jgi:hypothetical protein
MVLVNDFNTYEAAEDGIKAFIMANVNETWIKPRRDPTSYYNNVMEYDILAFLHTNSGGLHDVDLATLSSSDMLHYYATAEGIPEFILELEYSRPMSDATLLATAHAQVMGSQHYPEAVCDWERLLPAAKTWVAWQAAFCLANIEWDRLLKINPMAFGNAAFTMALDNIANAATNDANLIATLMARINALEIKAGQPPPSIETGATRNTTNTTIHSYLVSTRWWRH